MTTGMTPAQVEEFTARLAAASADIARDLGVDPDDFGVVLNTRIRPDHVMIEVTTDLAPVTPIAADSLENLTPIGFYGMDKMYAYVDGEPVEVSEIGRDENGDVYAIEIPPGRNVHVVFKSTDAG